MSQAKKNTHKPKKRRLKGNMRLPQGLTVIGKQAFAYCLKLRKLVIPYGVIHVGMSLIEGCSSLEDLYLPQTLRLDSDSSLHSRDDSASIKFTLHATRGSEAWDYAAKYGFKALDPLGNGRLNQDTYKSLSPDSNDQPNNEVQWLKELGPYMDRTPSVDFSNKKYVITGFSGEESEDRLIEDIGRRGAIYRGKISGQTDILIADPTYAGKSKARDLVEQRKRGHKIRIILLHQLEHWLLRQDLIEAQKSKTWKGSLINLSECTVENGVLLSYQGTQRDIRLPDKIQSIGIKAFAHNTKLRSIFLPPGLSNIGEEAFANCSSLQYVEFPRSLKRLGHRAFASCASLDFLRLPARVLDIGDGAFSGCEQLLMVDLQKGLGSIGAYAFENCKNLRSLAIPEGTLTVGEWAFKGCPGLKDLIMPDTLLLHPDLTLLEATTEPLSEENTNSPYPTFHVVKGSSAWQYALKMGYPKKVYALRERIYFEPQEDKKGIWITDPPLGQDREKEAWLKQYGPHLVPYPTVQIPDKKFVFTGLYEDYRRDPKRHPLVQEVQKQGGLFRTSVSGQTDYLVVNPAWAGKSKIDQAISLNKEEKKIKIILQEDLEKLLANPDVFQGLDSWIEEEENLVTVPLNQCKIEEGKLVKYTGKANKIQLPDGIQSIGKDAFANRLKLKTIIIPEGVTGIEDRAFANCPSLVEISLPDTLSHVGPYAFCACGALKSIDFPDSVEDIPEGCFLACKNLSWIGLPDSLKSIGDRAFAYCHSLKTVEGIAEVFDTDIYVPPIYRVDAVSIDGKAVKDWSYQEREGEIYLEDYLGDQDHIVVPSFIDDKPVRNIMDYGLKDCRASVVEIPGSITHLAPGVGSRNGWISQVVIGEGVVSLGNHCFSNLPGLRTVQVSKSIVFVGEGVFEATPWEKEQKSLLIAGSVLIRMKGDRQVLNVPKGIRTIGSYVAPSGANLHKVILSDTVTVLCDNAFGHESNVQIEEFVYSDNLTEIGVNALGHNRWTKSFVDQPHIIGGHLYRHHNQSSKTITIPEGVTRICQEAFKDDLLVQTIKLPKTLRAIDSRAFYQCTNLTSVSFNEGMEDIGEAAFYGCSKLNNLSFPDTLVRIGKQAFSKCRELTEVKLGASILELGSKAFDSCYGLTIVEMNNNLSMIEEETFRGCTSLFQVLLPDSLREIGSKAFWGCKVLQNLSLPKGLQSIHRSAFESCTSLANVIMNNNLIIIEEEAFRRCTSLSQVLLPDSLREIGSNAFRDCKALQQLSLPEGLQSISQSAFEGCTNLIDIQFSDSITRIEDRAFRECLSLVKINLSQTLISTGKSSFENCKNLVEVVMADAVKIVGDDSFYGCSALKEIVLSPSLEQIGSSAFHFCTGLISANIPHGVSVLESNLFRGCSSLSQVIFPGTLENIGASAFQDCTSLKSINLPNKVRLIDDDGFRGCSSLEDMVLSESLESIGASAFRDCIKLAGVRIPDSVTSIGDSAFKDCIELSEVSLPNTIDHLGTDIFTNTPYMRKTHDEFYVVDGVLVKYLGAEHDVVIPDGITSLGKRSFAEAHHVKTITIHDNVKTIEDDLMGSHNPHDQDDEPQLRKLILGDGLETIGDRAFSECRKLEEVTFGKSLTTIGIEAFRYCESLEDLDLSQTRLIEIEHEAFCACFEIRNLVFPDTLEHIGKGAFSRICLDAIHLPKSVRVIEKEAFAGASELIIYDTIEPDAKEAGQDSGTPSRYFDHKPLANILNGRRIVDVALEGDQWRSFRLDGYHITVLSAETGTIKYRIFYDRTEGYDYQSMMESAWGRHASFTFDTYDEHFLKIRNSLAPIEIAFCRIQYPGGLSDSHRVNYERFLEQCLYIEQSARKTAAIIAHKDAVDRLELLDRYQAINDRNLSWIREEFLKKDASKCLIYLEETFSDKEY